MGSIFSPLHFSKFSKFSIVSWHCIQITHTKSYLKKKKRCENAPRLSPFFLSSEICLEGQPQLSSFLGKWQALHLFDGPSSQPSWAQDETFLQAQRGQRTKSSKGVPQIILVDEAIPVLVHDGEGLWKGGGSLVSPGEIGVGRSPRGWAMGQGKWDSGIFKEHWRTFYPESKI